MILSRSEFQDRPWHAIPPLDMAAALAVSSMLGPEESQLYHWVGRRAQGLGATVDLGAFAGGSAARLLSGLALSGHRHHLHAYDFFTATGKARARWVPDAKPDSNGVADILPHVMARLAPWHGQFTLHRGDIGQAQWSGDPIEILAVDAAKSTALTDHTATQFYPALLPGQSVMIHQDFLHDILPWIPAQMVALRHCFEPLAKVENDCLVFMCHRVPSALELQGARTDGLSDGDLCQRVLLAANWLKAMVPEHRFEKMIHKIQANPGVRIGWKMK